MKQLHSFINGTYLIEKNTSVVDIINPATAQKIAAAYNATPAVIDLAVLSALQGFQTWQSYSPAERGDILYRISQLLYQYNDELAALEVLNTGKPLQEANCVDIVSGADCLKYFAGLTDKITGLQQPVAGGFYYTRREPLGICLGIGAWNYPMQIACWKAALALAAGNSMIFKPSELTPCTALKLAEIMIEAGLPKGVFNVVLADKEQSALLTTHPKINKISLTGSVATGKIVGAHAGKQLKPVTLELGGKSPLIIFDDADIDSAVAAAMLANFYTQGEICSNGTRVFVHKDCYDQFITKALGATQRIKIGDPNNIDTQMGALISKSHQQRVQQYIRTGIEEGATLLTGGETINVPSCPEGFFVPPTIFTDCKDTMTIAKEEIFGPVMTVFQFASETDVIARANDTPYGLAAGVFSNNIQRGHRVAAQLEAGVCWINAYNITPVEMPFGGYKQSGLGRENGIEALQAYTQVKSVYVAMAPIENPY